MGTEESKKKGSTSMTFIKDLSKKKREGWKEDPPQKKAESPQKGRSKETSQRKKC